MLSEELYNKQIRRIEACFNYSLDVKAIPVWYKELNNNHITNSDLVAGVNEGVNPGASTHWKFRPTVIDLLDKCHFAKHERLKAEERRDKRQEEENADKPLKDLLSKDRAKSPLAKKLCANLHDLFEDKIDLATFKRRDLDIKAQRTTG